MRPTRWLLIGVLVLASAGCVKRDWVSDLLVLTDVTGTWEGSVRANYGIGHGSGIILPMTLVLQQAGPKVTGELSSSSGQRRLEGVVNGEVLTLREGIKVDLAVDGDEMWGTTQNPLFGDPRVHCQPACFLRFRRVGSPAPASSEAPARREP